MHMSHDFFLITNLPLKGSKYINRIGEYFFLGKTTHRGCYKIPVISDFFFPNDLWEIVGSRSKLEKRVEHVFEYIIMRLKTSKFNARTWSCENLSLEIV